MARKILLWGMLGGVVMFFWGFVSHTFLPIGEAGFRILPEDAALLEFMAGKATEPGIYFYPRLDPKAGPEHMEQWQERAQGGPSGLIVHRPRGGLGMTPRLLLNDLLSNIACGLVAAWLLAQLPTVSFLRRALCVALLGVLAWLAVDFSQWNWYGFPAAYTVAAFCDQVMGFFLMGLVIASKAKA